MNLKKRGQFYLIAAVLLIVIVFGLISVGNYTSSSDIDLSHLVEDLNSESGQVVSYGTYWNQDTNELLEDWVANYTTYTQSQGEQGDWIFVYGNASGLNAVTFTEEESSISINVGGSTNSVNIQGSGKQKSTINPSGNRDVSIELLGNSYNFDLKEGENFFFILSREEEGERVVLTESE